jgi:vacuolar-type H+-ATPase subunit I/STV1
MHWVLVYGYEPNTETFYICDPWTGRADLTLDVYGGTRRAVIQFRTYTQTLPKQDQPTTSQDQALQECQINLQKEIQTKNETYQELQEWKFKYEEEIEAHKKTQENTDNVLNQQISIVDPTGALQVKTFANVNAQIKTLLLKEDTLRQLEAKHTECVTTLTVVRQKQVELEEANKSLTLTNTQQAEHLDKANKLINELQVDIDDMQKIIESTTTHESLLKLGKLSICKIQESEVK